MILKDLEPCEVFHYFEEICSIPHGSGNTEKIAQYCLDFAKEHHLEARKDQVGNVVIYAPGTPGYEHSDTVILQGHLDMVCEKDPDLDKDMETEEITVRTDGEYVFADKTTLGGDDGIAIAYIFAILASKEIPHPPIEALLTNDEEVGMLGARDLDVSLLHAKKLINIDSEEEGILNVSCAGGVRADGLIPVTFKDIDENRMCFSELVVSGLTGGHSGIEIHKQRINAVKVLADILQDVQRIVPIHLIELAGGMKDNVIPNHASARFAYPKEQKDKIIGHIHQSMEVFQANLSNLEPGVTIRLKEAEESNKAMDEKDTSKSLFALCYSPDGVIRMSPEMADLTETSLNMGIVKLQEENLHMGYLLRSNVASGKELLMKKLDSYFQFLEGTITYKADYPAWEYREDSLLRDTMIQSFKEVYGKEPKIMGIHAGLECGILSGKMPGSDMVSFGPDLFDVHTPKERMNIASADRCFEYLKQILKNMK